MTEYIWLIPLLPLAGVILNAVIALVAERPLLLARHAGEIEGHGPHDDPLFHAFYRKVVSFIGPGVVGLSFLISLLCVISLISHPPDERIFKVDLFTWIQAGAFSAPLLPSTSTHSPPS